MSKQQAGLKTFSAYVWGLFWCLVLTFASFGLAYYYHQSQDFMFNKAHMIWLLMVLAAVQLFVQVVYFLRLNSTKEGRWELMPFLFTLFVVFIIAGGSLWIMYSLNYYMVH